MPTLTQKKTINTSTQVAARTHSKSGAKLANTTTSRPRAKPKPAKLPSGPVMVVVSPPWMTRSSETLRGRRKQHRRMLKTNAYKAFNLMPVDKSDMGHGPQALNNDEDLFNKTFGTDVDDDDTDAEDGERPPEEEEPLDNNDDVIDPEDKEGDDNAEDDHMDIEVDDSPLPATPSKKGNALEKHCRCMALNISPTRSRAGGSNSSPLCSIAKGAATPPPRRRHSGKITNNDFTPRTLRLAITGKLSACQATTTENAFPPDKNAFLLALAQKLAVSDNEEFAQVFARGLVNVELQRDFATFLGYARTGIFTSYIARARQWVPSRYGLPGTMSLAEVKSLVTWLLHDG
ncbi:hypothetical protein BT96DRAFT_998798 [Gymnopus androsaceus JB14]|uniref:Uncharacterized protein n=1 Tax=Gymnopus androsaceus JB14 TaxID=1447944 RepID=A0A6A4H9Z9_9AGAR|nr:hypothetical protein BT96DRAFT_998798 [Gymnopus androsaceus JB14]